MIIQKYKHPILFYALSIAIPWILWFIAAYISHNAPDNRQFVLLSGGLSLLGLIAPVIVALFLILPNKELKRDYYHSNLVESGLIYSLNFIVSLFPFVIIMNWLYYKTNRNIFVTIVFHITAGYFNEIFATHPMSKVIQTVLLLFLSIYLIIKDKELFFEYKKFNIRQ